MKLGVLVSGNLGYELLYKLASMHDISFVMTDKHSNGIIDFCHDRGIEIFIGNPRINAVDEFLSDKKIETLISVNYLFLIEKNLINLPSKIAFNVHGSLLPKYRGRTPHVWSIINNEKITGITAHLIDIGCDSGDIIEQLEVKIDYLDTGNDLLDKFRILYPQIIDKVLNQIENDSLNLIPQNNNLATYFGKRVPDDGQIVWSWQKERIRNWVRALSYPYPGAFTYCDGVKIIIDEVEFVDFGFNHNTDDGTILEINPLLVKTPNGVIELKKIRTNISSLAHAKILN